MNTARAWLQLPWLAAVYLGVPASFPSQAHACGPTPCASVARTMPAQGVRGVPLNTEIRILYHGGLAGYEPDATTCELTLSVRNVRLLADGGDVIPLELEPMEGLPDGDRSWRVARPPAPLAPNTHYVLERAIGATHNSPCACTGPMSWSSVSEFWTGTAPDDAPPALDTDAHLVLGEPISSWSMCGVTHGFRVALPATGARDDHPGVAYDVFVDGALLAPSVDGSQPELFINCGEYGPFGSAVLPERAVVQLRAVDLAGHTSALTDPVVLDADCASVPAPRSPFDEVSSDASEPGATPATTTPAPDTPSAADVGGTAGAPGTGAADAGSTENPSAATGQAEACTLARAHGHRSSGGWALATLAAALVLRSTRRRLH